jgi:hypothetical protein
VATPTDTFFSKSTLARFARDVVLSAAATGAIVAVGAVFHVVPLEVLISVGATALVALAIGFAFFRSSRHAVIGSDIGLLGIWRDEDHFKQVKGVSYKEYCQRFVSECADGATIRIVGYYWIEVFQDTTLLANDIFGPDGSSRLRFNVILADPGSAAAIEKRAWEMLWRDSEGNPLYPEGASDVSLHRLVSKIETCVTVARIFQQERPQYFDLKVTPTMLNVSAILRDDRAIGQIYSAPWKGCDSVIFEAERLPRGKVERFGSQRRRTYGNDLYGVIEGYWNALWQHPDWHCVEMRMRQEPLVTSETHESAAE